MSEDALTPAHIARVDESDDSEFYRAPRLVKHIDEPACAALADWYGKNLPEGGAILDLMSAWVSHLPEDKTYKRVCGLGMNEVELSENPQLTDWLVHDLTKNPTLPFADNAFDACTIAVSVQYLIHPLEVFRDIARVLKPGGMCAVSFSNRMFPTKAVAVWRAGSSADHAKIIGWYFNNAGGWETPEVTDISPDPFESDPLYIVSARVSSDEDGD